MENGFKPGKLSLLTILIASMMILMGGAAVAPALPEIGEVFSDYDGIFINLIITLPALAIVVSGMAIGALADRIGKVRVLVISLLVFGIAGVSGFVIDDLMLLLVGRFFVGVGIAGIACCTTALVSEYYTGQERNKVLGYQAAAMGMGAFVLELAGGTLASFGWHYPFLIYGIGLLMVLTAVVSLREPSRQTFDGELPEMEAPANAGFIRMFCYLSIFSAMLFMFVYPSKLPEYMEVHLGSSPTVTGLMLGAMGLSNAFVSMLHKRFSATTRELSIILYGFISIGIAGFFYFLEPSYPSILASAVFTGVGLGLLTPAVLNLLASVCTPATSGKVMGGYSTFNYLGQFLSTFLIAAAMAGFGGLTDSVFYAIAFGSFVMVAVTLMAKAKMPDL